MVGGPSGSRTTSTCRTQNVNRYMRIATYRDHLLSAENRPQSIKLPITYLRDTGAPAIGTGRNGRHPTFDVDEAKRLKKQGLTNKDIGAALGVSDVAIWRQLDSRRHRELSSSATGCAASDEPNNGRCANRNSPEGCPCRRQPCRCLRPAAQDRHRARPGVGGSGHRRDAQDTP